jgi:hypothetical protein
MAYLPEEKGWEPGVFQIETTTPWVGGLDGNCNKQARSIIKRLNYLKDFADEVGEAAEGGTLRERINAAGSAPRSLYQKPFVPDAPVAASTGNVDVQEGGLLLIDGVQTRAGDLVFLKDQTDAARNGFWEAQTGAWNRYAGYGNGETRCFTDLLIDIDSGETNKGLVFAVDADAYVVGESTLIFRETQLSPFPRPGKIMCRNRRGTTEEFENANPAGPALVDENRARNLFDVFGVSYIDRLMEILLNKNNADGNPDYSGLQYGDYIDGLDLTGGSVNIPWNEIYKNNRLVLSGINIYKGAGDTENVKNHLNFTFRHCPLTRRMNATDTNTGGYAATEMRTFLEGDFKTALENALGDHLLTVRRLLSTKGAWAWEDDAVFLLTEYEVWGAPVWSEVGHGGSFQAQYPLFRENVGYKLKRYNGSRMWWWEASPYSGSAAHFCNANYTGHASGSGVASSVGGCAPAFCVA